MADIKKDKWFIEFPTYQYNEDVVELALDNRLKIVDAQFKGDAIGQFEAPKVPKLTVKASFKKVSIADKDAEIEKLKAELAAAVKK